MASKKRRKHRRERQLSEVINWEDIKSNVNDYIDDLRDDLNFKAFVEIKDSSNQSTITDFIGRIFPKTSNIKRKLFLLKKFKHIEIVGSFMFKDPNFKKSRIGEFINGNEPTLKYALDTVSPYIDQLLSRLESDNLVPFIYSRFIFNAIFDTPHRIINLSYEKNENIYVYISISCYAPNTQGLKDEVNNLYKEYLDAFKGNPINNTKISNYSHSAKNFIRKFKEYDNTNFLLVDKFPLSN